MHRLAVFAVLLLCIPTAGLGQAKTYIGFFNDGSRTICGSGCQTSPPEIHPVCDENWGAPGNWTLEAAWLWVLVEEGGIDQIRFQIGFDPHDRECLQSGVHGSNHDIIAHETLHYTYQHKYEYNYVVDFNECVTGWVWIYRVGEYNCNDWDLYLRPYWPETGPQESAVKTRSCQQPDYPEHDAIVLCNYHFYAVPASQCPADNLFGTEVQSWGAIKSIYN